MIDDSENDSLNLNNQNDKELEYIFIFLLLISNVDFPAEISSDSLNNDNTINDTGYDDNNV